MTRVRRRSGLFCLCAAWVVLVALLSAAPHTAIAGSLPTPEGPVVLTISGQIEVPGGEARVDRAGLESLGLHHLKTQTYWTDGVQDFEGVLLRDLLRAVGAHGAVALMQALNNYSVEIPLSDAASFDVLIAIKINGEDMPIRDKGPLWLIYPIDQHPELDRKTTADKMIWQLFNITIN
jgi:hypothetical protein